jgi:AcrR family transcriptional regulator
MSTQIERSNATRAKIIAVARAAFVQDGYDESSLEKISAEAGVTKGALYHHYDGKAALFAAVFTLVSQETLATAGRRASRIDVPRAKLKGAAMAWLRIVESSDARTILIDLGPRVLGFAGARQLEELITLQPLLKLVHAVIETEKLRGHVEALLAARLINAALTEISLLRHASDGHSPSLKSAAHAIEGVIDGVLKGD